MSESIHLIGIGGAGMSGLARILARQGVTVSGSDQRETPTLERLRREYGVRATVGHDAANVEGATLVVVTAAVSEKINPEVQAARGLGIPVISRAEMLGRLMARYARSVAISGTHGKTTTTGMTTLVLEAGGLDPTVLIGGDLPALGGNARLGVSDVFLAEACEAYDSFLDLDPWLSVITNIEADHLDYYGDLDNVLRSFRRFLNQTTEAAIVCGDDANIRSLLPELTVPRVVTYGFGESVDLRGCCVRPDGCRQSFDVSWRGSALGHLTLGVPGRQNVHNSLAAVAVGLEFGLPFSQIADGLAAFTGTGRRFERLGETSNGVLVIDDYAHHPTEIRATLAAARQAFPERRIVAVFQPHLPSRTAEFKLPFAESFGDADFVVLTDIYLSREAPIPGVTGAGLAALTADRRGAAHVAYVSDKAALPVRLSELARPGDLVITLGAGDIRQAGEGFLGR